MCQGCGMPCVPGCGVSGQQGGLVCFLQARGQTDSRCAHLKICWKKVHKIISCKFFCSQTERHEWKHTNSPQHQMCPKTKSVSNNMAECSLFFSPAKRHCRNADVVMREVFYRCSLNLCTFKNCCVISTMCCLFIFVIICYVTLYWAFLELCIVFVILMISIF